jgi:hypothetical protein
LAAMAVGILLTGLACYALRQDDMLRPAFVAVILVTLAGGNGHWQTFAQRVAGVITGCICALVVGFLFDQLLKHVKLQPDDQSSKSGSQE